MITNRSNGWLTAKRLQVHGLLLGVALWSVYLWTLSSPGLIDRNGNFKGTDFLHFYTLGSLAVVHGGTDLYSMQAQTDLATRRVPQAARIHYLPLYPPQVSIAFAPFAHLSYGWALAFWWAATAIIYGVCCHCVWRACPNLGGYGFTVAVLTAAFPGFFNLIAWGQTSAIALACFTLLFFCLRDRREFLAGLALGCLIFKPQLGLAAAIVFLAVGAWEIVGGAILSAGTQLLAGVAYYGIGPLRQWIRMLFRVQSLVALLEPRPYQTYSLRTFWSMIVPSPNVASGLYAASAIAVLSLTILIWRQSVPLALKYSALLLATVLVAPHLTVYDLVILAPSFLLLANWLLAQPPGSEFRFFGPLLYLVYALPLLASVTRWIHVQLCVIAMTILLYFIWRTGLRKAIALGMLAEQE